MTAALDILLGVEPRSYRLPVEHLSPSSIDSFWKCPEQFRRERIQKEPVPTSGKQLFGSAFGKAAEINFRAKIASREDMTVERMRDVTGEAFNTVVEEEKGKREIVWRDTTPNKVQQGVICAMVGSESGLPGYLQVFAPTIQPVAVERTFRVIHEPTGIEITGRIDVEDETDTVTDLKTTSRAKTQVDLNKDNQASTYMWARVQEGNPAAEFRWHIAMQNTTKPTLQELVTNRSEDQLARFEEFVTMTVRTISRYLEDFGEDGPWPPAPTLAWWCSPTSCGFYGRDGGCPWRQA